MYIFQITSNCGKKQTRSVAKVNMLGGFSVCLFRFASSSSSCQGLGSVGTLCAWLPPPKKTKKNKTTTTKKYKYTPTTTKTQHTGRQRHRVCVCVCVCVCACTRACMHLSVLLHSQTVPSTHSLIQLQVNSLGETTGGQWRFSLTLLIFLPNPSSSLLAQLASHTMVGLKIRWGKFPAAEI